MAKMNYKQIEHCQQRLSKLRASKVGQVPAKPKGRSETELLKAIATGSFRLQPALLREACQRKLDSNNHYKDLEDFIIEIVYDKENAKALKIYEDRKAKFDELCAIVDTEITRIEDEIVLGDQKAAMDLIKAFETWTP